MPTIIKTQDLIGLPLEWAVAKIENLRLERAQFDVLAPLEEDDAPFASSTEWAQGGPIIAREIDNIARRTGYFYAHRFKRHQDRVTIDFNTIPGDREAFAYGPTPLIAAMRCYVASKLGDEIEVPDEVMAVAS